MRSCMHSLFSLSLGNEGTHEIRLLGYTDEYDKLQAVITLEKREGVEMGLDQITGLTLAFFIGNSTPSTDAGHEYK